MPTVVLLLTYYGIPGLQVTTLLFWMLFRRSDSGPKALSQMVGGDRLDRGGLMGPQGQMGTSEALSHKPASPKPSFLFNGYNRLIKHFQVENISFD